LGFLRLSNVAIHGMNEISILHDLPEGTNVSRTAPPALPQPDQRC